MKILEIQELCRKELNVFVGKTICRREKNKLLSRAVRDYRVEFAKLHDYVDEVKRLNLGATYFSKVKRLENGG